MQLPSEISFIVSQNDKGNNPKRPDYRGEVKIAGAVYELAAWRKKKQGTDRQFISGTLKLKGVKPETQQEEEPKREDPPFRPAPEQNLDEDVPF